MISLSWREVADRRLVEGLLAEGAATDDVVEIASRVCGLQAQILQAAELGVAARTHGLTQAAVRAALWQERTLVKTEGPRGTLHLLPSRELGLWLAAKRAAAARAERAGTHSGAAAGLTPKQAGALRAAVLDALDGRTLEREQLAEEVSRRAGKWAHDRLASTWMDLISVPLGDGIACFGPNHGAKITFARTDQWLGEVPEWGPEDALLEVLRRFLRAYGPASPRDFATWLAPRDLKAGDVTALLEALGDEVERVEVEGKRGWWLAGAVPVAADLPRSTVRLLPQYDAYVMGARFGRDRVFGEAASAHAKTRYEGVAQFPWVMVDGVAAGTWERRRQAGTLRVRFFELEPVPMEQLEAEIARTARFLGADAELTVEPLPGREQACT